MVGSVVGNGWGSEVGFRGISVGIIDALFHGSFDGARDRS